MYFVMVMDSNHRAKISKKSVIKIHFSRLNVKTQIFYVFLHQYFHKKMPMVHFSFWRLFTRQIYAFLINFPAKKESEYKKASLSLLIFLFLFEMKTHPLPKIEETSLATNIAIFPQLLLSFRRKISFFIRIPGNCFVNKQEISIFAW